MFKRITSILLSVAITFSAVGAAIMLPTMADNGFTPQHMEVDFSGYEVKDSVTYPNSNNTYASADANPSCLWSIKDDNGNKYLECNKSNSFTNPGSGYYSFILNPKGVAGNSRNDASFTKDAEIFSLEDGARYRLTFRYKLPTMWNNKEIRVKIGASGLGNVGYNDGTLSYSLTDDDTAEGPVKLKTGNDWQTATIECTVKAKGWKNMVDSLVVGFILTNSTTGNPTGDGAYKLSVDDFVIDRLGAAEITDTDGNTETVYGVPACNPEYKAGFGICDAESVPFSESYENKSDYENGNYTASAKVIKYYSDKQLTTPITSAVFMPSVSKYYCNKIYETLAYDQVAFCGFDEHNLRKSFDISGTSTALRNWDSFVRCGYRNKKWSISSAEAFTGTKSVYINTTEWDSDTTQRSRYLYVGNGYELEPGKTYNISLWVKRDTSKTQTGDLNIGFVNAGDFNSPNWLKGAKILNADFNGEWQQIVFENVKIPETQSRENYTLPYGYYMAPVLQIASDNAFWLDTVVINEVVKNEYWSGTEAANYAGGSGTAEDPYQISTPEELALLCKTVKESKWGSYEQSTKGKYYVLTKDIKINDTSKANWKDTAKEWYTNDKSVSSTPCFKGVFDGKGHKISGIYINNSASGSTGGLFIQIGKGAVVKNVGIENSYIKSNGNAGSIAGSVMFEDESADKGAAAPKLIACYGGENVTIDGGDGYAGGMFGSCARFAELRYCYFIGTVTSTNEEKNGGLVGGNWGGGNEGTKGNVTYRSCYSAPKNEKNFTGGKSNGTKATNSYATFNKNSKNTTILGGLNILAVERMTGNEALQFMKKFDFNQVWRVVEGRTPTLRVFEPDFKGTDPEFVNDAYEMQVYDGAKPGDIWTGRISSKYASGTGKKDDPYIIETAEQFALLAYEVNNSYWDNYLTEGVYYKLTADIKLNDVSADNWYENGNLNDWFTGTLQDQAFCGHLDGNGYVISGVYINSEDAKFAGLFPSAGRKSVLENIGLIDSYIVTETGYSGGLYAYVENRSFDKNSPVVRNCFVGENVYLDSPSIAGGIVAALPSTITIENCYFLGDFGPTTNPNRIGGAYGHSWYSGKYKYKDSGEMIKTVVKNMFVCNTAKDKVIGGRGNPNIPDMEFSNLFALRSHGGVSTMIGFSNMTDQKAAKYLTGFDFENDWETVEKSTPILKIFANKGHDISKLVRVKGPVTITFETYGGTNLEPMSAYSGSSLQLPTPTRNKDVFDDWYVYPLKTFDVPFNYDFFPDDDVTLYAKWIDAGITQDFEEYTYTADEDGMEEGYEVFKPGSIEYNGEYVKGGIRSLHRLNTVEEYKNACIFSAKDSKLVPGTEYEISMYVYLKDKPKADDKIMLAYTQYADWAFDENATQELGKLSDISTGSWQYVKYKFVAYSEYVAFRLPAVEMFIDDVYILTTDRANLKSDAVKSLPKTVTTVIDVDNGSADTNTGNTDNNTAKTGKKKIIRKIIKKKANTDNTSYTLYFVIAGAAVVLAGAVTTAVIVVRKKRKNIEI